MQLATLYAAGAWMPRDWQKGLDCLERAAVGGNARAQAQLRLLALSDPLASSCDWSGLRKLVSLADWSTPAARESLCESPRIRRVPGFVSPAVCRWLRQCSENRLMPALMFNGRNATFSADRNNSDFAFDMLTADLVILMIRERISATTRLPTFAMEPPQIFHYSRGQEIKAHYDHVQSSTGYEAERIATFLLYLNDDYEGGELDFVKIGLRHRGVCGDGIYFSNVDSDGRPDYSTLHAALPVLRGEKWILSQWIQDRTFGAAGGRDASTNAR